MRVPYDAMCFACGVDNPKGLKLVFENRGGEARAVWTPGPEHVGWAGVIHGGLISTLLDEAMAYALIYSGVFGVTGHLRVRYRRQLHPGDRVVVAARVLGAKGRLIRAIGKVRRLEEPVGLPKGWSEGAASGGGWLGGGQLSSSRPGEGWLYAGAREEGAPGEVIAEAEATFVEISSVDHHVKQ